MTHSDSRPLPSRRQLLKATAIAVAVASVLLVTIVLPAEYGIDPTGIGARLGLTRMAEIADADASATAPGTADADADAATEDAAVAAAPPPVSPTLAAGDGVLEDAISRRSGLPTTDAYSLTLEPGKGAEVKTHMNNGDGFVFHWTATGGEVAVDMHGERTGAAKDEYTSYWIEPEQGSASGTFTAPFDGVHGWFWHNRGTTPVTIRVEVSGFQGKLYQP